MNATEKFTVETGSINVYADLGYADSAEMQRKSQLAGEIARAIKARRLTQEDAAALLGMPSKAAASSWVNRRALMARAISPAN